MKKLTKSVLAVLMMVCMLFSLTACGGGDTNTPTPTPTQAAEPGNETTDPTQTPDPTVVPDEPKEIVTIKYGTHWLQGLDPHYTDEVTGEYVMEASLREARYAAEEAIYEQLGVVFEYVQYPSDTREALLQSVVAGDPICDLAVMWGGSESEILAQNVLQKLDDYAYIFLEDEDYSWMLYDKLYGHYYMLSDVVRFNQRWPLCYNVDLIEEAGLENPSVTFANGNWTWSTFKELLTKLDAFYANDNTVEAYQTDTRMATLSAAYSAGGAIYGANGLAVDSQGMKDAVAYMDSLLDAGLLQVTGVYDDGYTPEWCVAGERFVYGRDGVFTVFTDCPDWYIGWATGEAANRGESIGIVPWPRPDSLDIDSEDYRQVITLGDSVGVLKGVSAEKTELALKAYALYTKVYYTTLAGVETMAEYQEAYGTQQAVSYGLDIYHEEYGDAILESFLYITSKMPDGKDYSDILGFRGTWDEVLGKSLFGIGGTASYDVAIAANINKFAEKVTEMEAILSSEGINDTVSPSVALNGTIVAVPAGTTMTDSIWMDFLTVTDNADGTLGFDSFMPEFNTWETDTKMAAEYGEGAVFTEADLQNVGYYYRMFKAYFADSSGNKGYCTVSVYVYDLNNTEKPVLTAHTSPMYISLNTDVNTLTWIGTEYNAALVSAVDADGLDISGNIKADLSTLDSSTPGTYDVVITATDYVGNEAQVTVQVIVE